MSEPRERDRYGRQSLREQVEEFVRGVRGQRALVVIVLLVFGGWFLLNILTPTPLKPADLATGQCVYIKATDADTDSPDGRQAGTGSGAVTALYDTGAETAPCDGSHSHEVVLAITLDDTAGTPYPGNAALVDRNRAACEAAFTEYVGVAPADSSLDLVIAVPSEAAWDKGVRAAPCLVMSQDGSFLHGSVKGTAR